MQRYFIEENYEEKTAYELKGDAYHHITHVMRMKVNQQLFVVFPNQISILAEISEIAESSVWVKKISQETTQKELPVAITIASGYPKGDKLEWIIQKGTELGAHAFIGFPAKSSVVKWIETFVYKAGVPISSFLIFLSFVSLVVIYLHLPGIYSILVTLFLGGDYSIIPFGHLFCNGESYPRN